MEPEDLVRDLAQRTAANLHAIVEAEKHNARVFPATQLVNSLLSLLVLPRQRLVLPKTPLPEIKAAGWPLPTASDGYDEDKNLRSLIIHLRNAVCHARFEFMGQDTNGTREITGIVFWDRKSEDRPIHWKTSISIRDLEGFVTRFSEVIEKAELHHGKISGSPVKQSAAETPP
jgi:hypothetical protein